MNSINNNTITENATPVADKKTPFAATGQKALDMILGIDNTWKDEMYPPKPDVDLTIQFLKRNRLRANKVAAEEETRKKRALLPVVHLQVKKPRLAQEQIEEERPLPALDRLEMTAPPRPDHTAESHKGIKRVRDRLQGYINQLSIEALKKIHLTFAPSTAMIRFDPKEFPTCAKILADIRTSLRSNCKYSLITPAQYAEKLDIINYAQNRLKSLLKN